MMSAGYRVGKNQDGFSLIEIVITLVVLSIAAVGVLTVFATGLKVSANPSLNGQATQLVQEKIDIIMGDRSNTARGFNYIMPANYPAEAFGTIAGFPLFSRNVTIYCANAGNLNANNGNAPPCTISGYTHVAVTVTNATIGSITADTVVTYY